MFKWFSECTLVAVNNSVLPWQCSLCKLVASCFDLPAPSLIFLHALLKGNSTFNHICNSVYYIFRIVRNSVHINIVQLYVHCISVGEVEGSFQKDAKWEVKHCSSQIIVRIIMIRCIQPLPVSLRMALLSSFRSSYTLVPATSRSSFRRWESGDSASWLISEK